MITSRFKKYLVCIDPIYYKGNNTYQFWSKDNKSARETDKDLLYNFAYNGNIDHNKIKKYTFISFAINLIIFATPEFIMDTCLVDFLINGIKTDKDPNFVKLYRICLILILFKIHTFRKYELLNNCVNTNKSVFALLVHSYREIKPDDLKFILTKFKFPPLKNTCFKVFLRVINIENKNELCKFVYNSQLEINNILELNSLLPDIDYYGRIRIVKGLYLKSKYPYEYFSGYISRGTYILIKNLIEQKIELIKETFNSHMLKLFLSHKVENIFKRRKLNKNLLK